MAHQRRDDGKFVAYPNPISHLLAYTKIDLDTGCLEWIGATDRDGYGKITFNRKSMRPHRLAYKVLCNPDLKSDQQLNHTCHNRLCWNPNHVYVGTQQQNIDDREAAGNTRRGAHHHSTKVNDGVIGDIWRLRAEGKTIKQIAICLSLGISTISGIVSSKRGFPDG